MNCGKSFNNFTAWTSLTYANLRNYQQRTANQIVMGGQTRNPAAKRECPPIKQVQLSPTMFDIFRAIQQLFVEIEVGRGPDGIKADCVAGDVEDCWVAASELHSWLRNRHAAATSMLMNAIQGVARDLIPLEV